MPVLILSVYPAEPYAVRAFRAGASGYVKKDSVGDELVKAVKTVVERTPLRDAGDRREPCRRSESPEAANATTRSPIASSR